MSVKGGPDIVTDGLALHLDAGNSKSYPGSGTSWYDLSGNNKHFSWSSTPPHNSIGVPYFSTNGRTCSGPASNSFGINNTSGYTIITVCILNSIANYTTFNFYGSGTYSRGIFAHLSWGNQNVYFDQGGCCASSQRINAAFSNLTTKWFFTIFRRKGNERRLYQNLTSRASTTVGAANINLTSTGARVVDTTSWNAKLSMFSVYNRGLEDYEIEDFYNAFKGRFGL